MDPVKNEVKEDLKPVEQVQEKQVLSEKPVVQDIPTTKDGWQKLAKEDPIRYAELNQPRMDQIFRQNKEYQEKLAAAEERERNLLAQIQQTSPLPTPEINDAKYGNGRYPQTEEEWDNLFIERPSFANDLKLQFIAEKNKSRNEFEQTRKKAVEVLVSEHPDMYHYEIDAETNKPKLDSNGKPIVKRDPLTGGYAFNQDSEKGKLWLEIFNEDPQGWNSLKNAPQLMMAEMERILRIRGAQIVRGQNNTVDIDQSGVAPEGIAPPRSVSVKFASDEEKAHAEASVRRGTFKSLEEWVKFRDGENKGYAEQNRRPDFSKK